MKKVDISVILACYNEGPTFKDSVNKVIKLLSNLKMKWEIIFVEDKSTDQTLKNVKSLLSSIKNARLIVHSKNFGRGKSVSDGILASRGEICGYLDIDLEVSENYISIFVEEIQKGFDLAIGRRYYEGDLKSLSRFLASKIYAFLVAITLKIPISDTEAGYKFFRKDKVLPVLAKVKDKHWFWDTEICARAFWSGLKISQIPVLFVRRSDKRSTVRLVSDTWDYLVKIIKFRSQIPTKFRR